MNENLKITADAVVNFAVAEAGVAAIIAFAAITAGDAPWLCLNPNVGSN